MEKTHELEQLYRESDPRTRFMMARTLRILLDAQEMVSSLPGDARKTENAAKEGHQQKAATREEE